MDLSPSLTIALLIVCALILVVALNLIYIASVEARMLKISFVKMHRPSFSQTYTKITAKGFGYSKDSVCDNSFDKDRKPTLTLLFFSDLHAEYCFIPASKVISILKTESQKRKIDAVVFGGDICNNPKRSDIGIKYLQEIFVACKELGIPFYGITGNHDVELDKVAIAKCCFTDLRYESAVLKSESGITYELMGVNDTGRKNREWFQPQAHSNTDRQILIAHNPDSILHIEEGAFPDYMLSGHIHGGQIRTPFKIEFIRIHRDTLPKDNVIEGVFDYKQTRLFISRGIGCVGFPFRLGAPPEVSFVEFFDD